MMPAGRKIIPIPIKKAKGTNRPHRERVVPDPSKKKPVPPAWLNKRAKQIFHHMRKRIGDIQLDSATYTETLALLASRMEEVERFDKILNSEKESGYVFQTTNSFGDPVLKEHPAVRLREKAMKHVHALLVEFGLTPAAAQKVGTKREPQKKNEFEGF